MKYLLTQAVEMAISNQKISSLNTHGIKGNLVYVEKLCNECNIVFISERWLNKSEQNIIEAISSDKKIFFHSAIFIKLMIFIKAIRRL
jgi:hypothetical protein